MAKENESTMKWKIDVKELTQAMQQAKRNISLANAEFKNATAGMSKWQNSITGVEAKIKQLNSVNTNQREILAKLNEEYKIVVKELGEASPEAQKLATQILNQEAAVKKTDAQIENYSESLEGLKKADEEAESASAKLQKSIESQEEELDSLKKAYKEAILTKGEDSDEARALATQIVDLNRTLSEEQEQLEAADRAADELTESLSDAGDEATEASNGGFTILKGALANLVSEGIDLVIEGLRQMGEAIVDVGKSAVENYADYEQLVGGVETLFGTGGQSLEEYAQKVGKTTQEAEAEYNKLLSAQADVMANASEAYKTAGLSANDYMETVTGFSASLIQGLGGDTVKAAKMADLAITDMSDNANKMGTDIGSIMNAYQGFAKQNYTINLMSVA